MSFPDRWAWLGSTIAHWAYGSLAGGLYGVVAGSLRRPRVLYGLPFGATVWASGYVVLPVAGLYEPIWKYDARTLAWDLGAHLTYGAGTATMFWLLLQALHLVGAADVGDHRRRDTHDTGANFDCRGQLMFVGQLHETGWRAPGF